MIIDCRKDAWTTYWNKRAYLDGQEVRNCFYADDEAGTIGHYVNGEDGRLVIDLDTCRPKEAWTFEGQVEIRDLGDRPAKVGGVAVVRIGDQVVGEAVAWEIR